MVGSVLSGDSARRRFLKPLREGVISIGWQKNKKLDSIAQKPNTSEAYAVKYFELLAVEYDNAK